MSTDLKIYDKIRALAGNYKIMHNDVTWNTVIKDEEFLRGRRNLHDYSLDYFTLESLEDGNTITFTKSNYTAPNNTFYYSTDGGSTWTSANSTTTWSGLNTGSKVMMKCTASTWAQPASGNRNLWSFSSTKKYKVYGNMMSLLYGDNFVGQTTLLDSYTFYDMFYGSTYLTDAADLVLPATTLASYCYETMFYGCTSLTTPPKILPATTLTYVCYSGMFAYCASLTTAPELPATTLAQGCYQSMFSECASLTTAPELPATTLDYSCYRRMFEYCTSLTTAPELPATTLPQGCYESMFKACSSLHYIKCLATVINGQNDLYAVKNWVYGMASSGTFVKAASMSSWQTGDSGIPSGWTVQNA